MAAADGHRGRLLLIGGAAGPGLLERFVSLAGGAAADIVVLATASQDPGIQEQLYVEAFRRLGAGTRPVAAAGRPGRRPTTRPWRRR